VTTTPTALSPSAELHRAGHRPAEGARRERDQHRLERDQRDNKDENRRPVGQQHAPVQRHADGDEEEAEQQGAKRPRLGLDHVPIGRLGDDHPTQEGAEREGKIGPSCSCCRRQDHQERGRGEDLLVPRLRQEPEQRLDRVAPDQHRRKESDRGLERRQ
jgi:hypothetical protein